jgi:hypothetical protein
MFVDSVLFTTVFVPSPETEQLNVDEQDSALFTTVFVPSPETEPLKVDEQDSALGLRAWYKHCCKQH